MSYMPLTITQASLNQTALDWPRNMTNIYSAIDEAVARHSDILALAELDLTGYEVNDEFQRTDNNRVLAALDDIALYARARDPNLIVSIGHPWRVQRRDIPAQAGLEADRAKNPLYDRLSLPFNVQSLIMNGEILGMSAKTNLFNDERGYEKRYFNEWSLSAAQDVGGVFGTIEIPLNQKGTRTTQFGCPIIYVANKDNEGFYLSQGICETKWVASKYDGYPHDDSRYEQDNLIPAISRHVGGREGLVLLIPNASPPARDKIDKHVHLNKLASRFADVVVDTDGLGSSGSTFAQFGHRMIVQNERVLSYGERMKFSLAAANTATVNVQVLPSGAKAHASVTRDFKNNALASALAYQVNEKAKWDDPGNKDRHYEEIIRYTAFWLFDYMRKSGHRGIMEALSGGADSAFNSVMVSVMVHMGVDELGVEAFCDELSLPFKKEVMKAYKTGGKDAAIARCLKEFLTGVYIGTNNSSDETYEAARFLMEGGADPLTGEAVSGIGGKFVNRNVQDLLDFYGVLYAVEDTTKISPDDKQALMQDIAHYLNMSPHSTTPDERAEAAAELKEKYPQISDLVTAADGVTYENIQARGREVLIMLFANKERKMAVANPNLDEARNAYATFGGDLHSGTINLNAHMSKAYELLVMRYLYEHGVEGVMPPVRALGKVLKNRPTAELQPKNAQGEVVQHDEDALQRSFDQMDYISEQMLYGRVHEWSGERRINAGEVYARCRDHKLFKDVDENDLFNMVRLSYKRWEISQHKIHASPICPTYGRNVDHQTSQRTPNVHGNSKDEIALLGIDLMFSWAEGEGLDWTAEERAILEKRAWQDKSFVKTFDAAIWSGREGRDYDLKKLYKATTRQGFDSVFGVLNDNHPLHVVRREQMKLVA